MERERWAEISCMHGCKSPVFGLFYIPDGCAVRRDQVQALCQQHAISVQSTGPITVLEIHPDVDLEDPHASKGAS